MSRTRRAHYGAVLGIALIAAALFVTAIGGWGDVRSVLDVVAVILATLLVLRILSVAAMIGLRSVF